MKPGRKNNSQRERQPWIRKYEYDDSLSPIQSTVVSQSKNTFFPYTIYITVAPTYNNVPLL